MHCVRGFYSVRRHLRTGLSVATATAALSQASPWDVFKFSRSDSNNKQKDVGDKDGKPVPSGLTTGPTEEFDVLSLIPESLIDRQMKSSLKDIGNFAEGILSKIEKDPEHPLAINFALLRLYVLDRQKTEVVDSKLIRKLNVDDNLLAKVLYYFQYADYAYSTVPPIHTQDFVLNQLQESNNSAVKLPRHMVVFDHLTKTIIVSIRGTASVSDVITDLYVDAKPFLEDKVPVFPIGGGSGNSSVGRSSIMAHRGMAESAEALLDPVTKAIRSAWACKHGAYSNYKVVVTGHSLGAGTACLLSILLSKKSKIPVTTYAVAPPPILSESYFTKHQHFFDPFVQLSKDLQRADVDPSTAVEDMGKSVMQEIDHLRDFNPLQLVKSLEDAPCEIYSFVHNTDVISRSSHMEFLRFISALRTIDDLPMSAMERASILLRGSLSPTERSELDAALMSSDRKLIQDGDDFELYIPGKICWLKPLPTTSVVSTASTAIGTASDASATSTSDTSTSAPKLSTATTPDATATDAGVSSTMERIQNADWRSLLNSSLQVQHERKDSATSDNQKETSNQKPAPLYELLAVRDQRILNNGFMYYGDSMVGDHTLTSYQNALLNVVKDN